MYQKCEPDTHSHGYVDLERLDGLVRAHDGRFDEVKDVQRPCSDSGVLIIFLTDGLSNLL